jgi:arabinofuranan 3-O-arabinosyltransferase
MRLAAACSLLTALVFQQEPGRILPDTKLDLVAGPVGLLTRALHLWEPQGFFGQVQNQAYGYLFPMGPFFWLGHLAQLPAWAVQRAWMSLLVCVAFLGVVRLAGVLGLGTPGARLVGGLAYALSPRMITVLGAASVEALPMALAPWVLVPLVRGSLLGSPRAAAMRSGAAVLLTGGVNAVATAAVLPLPVLYLLTLRRGPRRAALIRWWSLSVALAVAWWAVPLLLLGRYSPPFLDFIESARVTTLPTNLADTLRGTDHWLAFLAGPDGPVWRAGWTLVTTPALVVESTLLAGVGLAGLCLRGLAHRTFLVLGVLTGFLLVTIGHVGPVDGLLAQPLQGLLDGPLAALRNVHKFDPVLRLPVALGVVHLVGRVSSADRRRVPVPTVAAAYVVVVALVAGVAAPALIREVAPERGFASVPGYWQETADWLAENGSGGRALLVPASRAGTYYWGDPRDEPLQALARSPWGVRDAIPLARPGHIRFLDAVERRLAAGRPSPGLAAYLRGAGVGYLVVRNDLDYARAGSARPVLVHAAISGSPGISRIATFGPAVGGGSTPQGLVDEQLDRPYPAVEVFAVGGAASVAEAYPADQLVQVSGGPEALLDLGDRGWLEGRPTVLTADAPPGLAPSRTVVTDTLRRREVNFGRQAGSASGVLAPQDPLRLGGTARDYLLDRGDGSRSSRHETVALWSGGRAVSSSSASDADAFAAARPEHQPFAALDGDPATAWLSGGSSGAVGEWFELRLDRPRTLAGVRLLLDEEAPGPRVVRLRVTTDGGSRVVRVGPEDRRIPLVLPAEPTSRLRVTALAVEGGGRGFTFGLREVSVSDLDVTRPLRTPVDLAGAAATRPAWVALGTDDDRRAGCTLVGERPLCAAVLARPGEEEGGVDRLVTLPAGGDYRRSVTVEPRAGEALTELLDGSVAGTRVRASSAEVADPRGSGQATADRDLGTGWVAAPGDDDPTLSVLLPETRRVTGLQVLVDTALAASRATSVIVRTPQGLRSGDLGPDGVVTFEAVRTARLDVSFPVVVPTSSYNPYTRETTFLPVGLSELRVLGADDLRLPASETALVASPCGDGPELVLGDVRVPTRVLAARGDVVAGRPLQAQPCGQGTTRLAAGPLRVTAESTPVWSVTDVGLVPDLEFPAPADLVGTEVTRWGAADRVVEVAARSQPAVLVVHENANEGWEATWEGRRLQRVTVDGWQQGYVVPEGAAGEVRLRFAPDGGYRLALLGGLLAALLLVGLALLPTRAAAGTAPDAPATPAALSWWSAAGLTVVGLTLLAGPAGALAAAAAVVAGRVVRGRVAGLFPAALALAAALAAGLLLAADVWGGGAAYAGDRWPAPTAALVALAAATTAWVRDGQDRTRPFQRRMRRSTRT